MSPSPTEELELDQSNDLDAVRFEWTELAALGDNVFGTWEWADAWQRHLGGGAELAIGIARRPGGDLVAILPLCVARHWPLRLVRFIGAGPSDELGPLCAPADRPAVAKALRRHVSDALDGSGIFLGERLWAEDRLAPALGAITVRRTASPVLIIGGRSFDEFLAARSRNFRNQVRRRERTLAKGGRLEFRLTLDPSQLDAEMRLLMRLHRARWSQGESSVFDGSRASFHLDFARRALENGWLRLWTMELDSRPVAAWYGFRFAGIESYYQAGRDPAFDHLNVGFVLLCHTIRAAFEDGMREYRFGSGDEPYKWRFTERDPGLEMVAIAAGARGRAALAAVLGVSRTPRSAQRLAWRLARGQRDAS